MTHSPADRQHGTGDRNENDVAKLDKELQDRRDKKKDKGAEEVNRQSKHDMGIERS